MGVYIKDMEMPKSCADCELAMHFDGYNENDCPFNSFSYYDCPLVPVPPHGRLIDADALEKDGADIHEDVVCCGYVEDSIWGFSHEMIENAPTIIPASED